MDLNLALCRYDRAIYFWGKKVWLVKCRDTIAEAIKHQPLSKNENKALLNRMMEINLFYPSYTVGSKIYFSKHEDKWKFVDDAIDLTIESKNSEECISPMDMSILKNIFCLKMNLEKKQINKYTPRNGH